MSDAAGIAIVIIVVEGLLRVYLHGLPRTGRYIFLSWLISAAATVAVLILGGFFG
jgi:hypothetical protein